MSLRRSLRLLVGSPGPLADRPDMSGQPHFQLDASMKLFTGLTTLAASLVTVAICAAEGFAGRAATAALAGA